MQGVPPFIAGFVMGDIVWLTLAVMGLAALARKAALAFTIIKFLGAAYLIYMAYQLWNATPILEGTPPGVPRVH